MQEATTRTSIKLRRSVLAEIKSRAAVRNVKDNDIMVELVEQSLGLAAAFSTLTPIQGHPPDESLLIDTSEAREALRVLSEFVENVSSHVASGGQHTRIGDASAGAPSADSGDRGGTETKEKRTARLPVRGRDATG